MLFTKSMNELSGMLERGETTAVSIAEEVIQRIESKNGSLNAFIAFDAAALRAQAVESDARRAAGRTLSRFDGIPLGIKDNIAVKGVQLSCASRILEGFSAPYDATVTELLKAKGFLCAGKTNLDEFAMGSTTESSHYGITRNPHDESRVPGGSSGGSAAAVAAGMVPVSLGSDTGGSIRQPASFCGVVGIKPTYGRVSRYGLVAYASSLDQIGTFARTVDDAADLLDAISAKDERDSTSVGGANDFASANLDGSVKGLRIGIPREYYEGVSPEVAAAVKDTVKALEAEGAVVKDVSLSLTRYAIPVYYLIATSEASSNLARFDGVRYGRRPEGVKNLSDLYRTARSEGFGTEVKRRIILGTYALSSGYYDAYYLQALKGRTLIIEDFKKAFAECDCLITPVTTSTAFGIGEKMNDPLEMYLSDILTISANLAAIPGVSVPVGRDAKGLPIGMQVMGPHFAERTILNVAKAAERLRGTIAIPA